jgi:protein phosphatase
MPVVQVSTATDIGRVRRNNEDYVKAQSVARDHRHFSIWAVADGVGGGPQGDRASLTAVETVVDYLTNEPWTDPWVALTEAFALANRNVFEITGEGAAASTLVVALVSEADRTVTIANVGDSRAYLVTGGKAWQITHDHSIVEARVAAGQITLEEARTAPDRNVLTRSIGSELEVLVDVYGPRPLQPNERLVLCSDGVHGMIDDPAIGQLSGGLPIAESAGALVAAALEAGGRDNATALVGGFEETAGAVQAPDPTPTAAAATAVSPGPTAGPATTPEADASPSSSEVPARPGRRRSPRQAILAAITRSRSPHD